MSDFYWVPMYGCSVHKGKAAGFEVMKDGERYRYACTEQCAMTQAAELARAHGIHKA